MHGTSRHILHYQQFLFLMEQQGSSIPVYVQRGFDNYLKCGRMEYRFLRLRCDGCHHQWLAASSRERRGNSPCCGARRMAQSAELLVDDVLPHQPIHQ